MNLIGRLNLYPVVAPVTLTIVSIYEKVAVPVDIVPQALPEDPSLVNKNVLVCNSKEGLILKLNVTPLGPAMSEAS